MNVHGIPATDSRHSKPSLYVRQFVKRSGSGRDAITACRRSIMPAGAVSVECLCHSMHSHSLLVQVIFTPLVRRGWPCPFPNPGGSSFRHYAGAAHQGAAILINDYTTEYTQSSDSTDNSTYTS